MLLIFLNINSVDIPLLDSTVRDINVKFQKDYINLTTKAIVLTNDILMNAKIVNKPTRPVEVEELNVNMDELNLNVITSALNDIEVYMTLDETAAKKAREEAAREAKKKAALDDLSEQVEEFIGEPVPADE